MNIQKYMEAMRATRGPHVNALNYFLVGLAGEVGEVMNQWQKHLRGDDHPDGFNGLATLTLALREERRDKIIGELGGVFWYLFAVCDSLRISPSEVMRLNAEKLADRARRGKIKGDGDER